MCMYANVGMCVCVLGRMCGDYVKPNAVLKHDSLRARVTSPRHLLPPLLLHLPTTLLILSSCPESFHPWPIDLVRFVFLISSPRRPHPFILLIQLVRRTAGRKDGKTHRRQMITDTFSSDLSHTRFIFFLHNGVFHRFRIFMEIQKTLSPVVVYIYLIYYIFFHRILYIYVYVCFTLYALAYYYLFPTLQSK